MDPSVILQFREGIRKQASENPRPLPWKDTHDPYIIWLSEIILQQTRVDQGMPYFHTFREKYPDVHRLAQTPEDEVLRDWQGLGYYSRARNMLKAARHISTDLRGKFPDTYKEILALSGVGPYTAAAIASFAFGLPHAVVDGNVYRVLSRYFGIETPVDTTEGKKQFAHLAGEVLDKEDPGGFNQAMMDFGALQCRPANPLCDRCPLSAGCSARRKGLQSQLPVKAKKIKRRDRYFNYIVLEQSGNIWIRKRSSKDIWQNLYEFPLLETDRPIASVEELRALPQWEEFFPGDGLSQRALPATKKQILSHQTIWATFWEFRPGKPSKGLQKDIFRVKRKNLGKFALPKVVDWYLKDKGLTLKLG